MLGELLVLDNNTWNHLTVQIETLFNSNTLNHLTEYKWMINTK